MLISEKYARSTAVITDTGDTYAYSDLDALSERLASVMGTRQLAFLLCENSIGCLVGYLAMLRCNIPAVLLDANKHIDMLRGLFDVYRPGYAWVPDAMCGVIGANKLCGCLGYSLLKLPNAPYDINQSLALLLTTSGSTGSPKMVRISRDNLLSNAYQVAESLEIGPDDRPVTSLPMHYSYGLSVINSHLVSGATILLTQNSVMQREFWQFVRDCSATSIAGVPYTYEMLRRLRVFDMDLPALRVMTQAGGRLNPKLVKEYMEGALRTGRRFVVMYGQTEATARMSCMPADVALEKCSSIGIPVPGGSFRLIDGDGFEISEPDREGQLVYAGPNVSMGYATTKEDLSRGDDNQGVLYTGDLAMRDADGYYYITGRLTRFVKVWGNRCNLDSVEQLVKTVTETCACVGVDDLITVFVTGQANESTIRSMLAERTGLNVRAFRVKVIDSIPMSPSGKPQYAQLQKMITGSPNI